MESIDFSRLSFGDIEAERDDLLEEAFIDINIYHNVLKGKISYVIGRKGSGKSAIYEYINRKKKREKGVLVNALTFDDYPWNIHSKLEDGSVPPEDRYKHTWNFIILIALAKNVMKSKSWLSKYIIGGKDIRSIALYLKNKFSTYSPNLIELLADKTKKINVKLFGSGFEFKDIQEQVRVANENINLFNREYIGRIIESLDNGIEYFVLFDKLDTGWDPRENKGEILIGLLKACRKINIEARRAGKSVKVIVFLRDDIYDSLRYEDKSKYEDSVERIKWDKEGLEKLIVKRIQISTGYRNADLSSIFSMKRIGKNEKQFDYILRRTMLRPRDLLVFCIECLNEYKKLSEEGKRHNKFNNNIIKIAEKEYSERFKSELLDENYKSNPELEDIFTAIRECGLERVACSDIEGRISQHTNVEPEDALKLLYNLGILGHYIRGGGIYGRGITFKFHDREFELDFSKKLYFHPALKKCLNLKEPRKGK